MLKSLFTEKDYKQLESMYTLIKKWKQWKKCILSFNVLNKVFSVIEFTSKRKLTRRLTTTQFIKLLKMIVIF